MDAIVDNTSDLTAAVANPDISRVYLLDGTYTPNNLTISREIALCNYPGAHPVIAGNGYRALTVYGSNVTLDGLALDGSQAQFEAVKVTTGNSLPRPVNVRLHDLTIRNAKAHGILVTHTDSVTVDGCTITETGLRGDLGYDPHGIYISDTDRAIVRNNYIRPRRGLSVHVYSGKSGQVAVIESNDLDNVGCYYGVCVVRGNILKQLYLRYEIQAAQVEGNTFADGRVFIHNLNQDALFHISHNFFSRSEIAGYNPNGKNVSADIDRNLFVKCPAIELEFAADEHDNITLE